MVIEPVVLSQGYPHILVLVSLRRMDTGIAVQEMQVASAQRSPGFGMCWHHSSAGSGHGSLLS